MTERVAAGITFLDKRKPDWRGYISLARLDTKNAFKCILGQIYGSYEFGLTVLGITHVESEAYGFNIENCEDHDGPISDELIRLHNELTAEWEEALGS